MAKCRRANLYKLRTMKLTEEIFKNETAIIKGAEEVLETDTYYQEHAYDTGKLAYKYGRITMNLAQQITTLQKEIKNLKTK